MAKKLYEETNLIAVGDALRRKLGNTRTEEFNVYGVVFSLNSTGHESFTQTTSYDEGASYMWDAGEEVNWHIQVSTRKGRARFCPVYHDPTANTFPVDNPSLVVVGGYTVDTWEDVTNQYLLFKNSRYMTMDFGCNYSGESAECGIYIQMYCEKSDGTKVSPIDKKETAWWSIATKGNTHIVRNLPNTFKTKDMANAIDSITDASDVVMPTFGTGKFTANGVYSASLVDGVDGYSSVEVDVQPTLVDYTITENGTFYADDQDAYGFRSVSVNVPVSAVSMDFDKDISADYYPVVRTDSTGNIVFHTGGISNETRGVMGTSTATYKIWLPSGGWEVGKNIMEHTLTPVSLSSSTYFYQGYFCLVSASITTPTLDDLIMKYWGESTGPIYRYTSCSITNSDAINSMGQLAIVDTTGMVKFAGTWQQVIDALNARTVDVSKGFVLLTSTYFSSNKAANRKYGRIDFN